MHLMKTFLVIFLMMINIEGYPNDKDIEESINFKNMKKFRGRSSSFDSGAATASPTAAVKELDQVKSDLTVCKNELANCQSSLQNLRTIQQSACPESSVEMNEQLITCQKSLLGTNKQIVCLNNYRQLSIRMFNRLKLQMSRLTEASGISNAESLDLIIPLSKLWASIDTGLMEKDDQCLL